MGGAKSKGGIPPALWDFPLPEVTRQPESLLGVVSIPSESQAKTIAVIHAELTANQATSFSVESHGLLTVDDEPSHTSITSKCCDDRFNPPEYVAFGTDVFSRKIVGWSVSSTLRTDMLSLQALNMAAWMVLDDLTGLVHSDRGANYVSLAYTNRIVELCGTPSVGSKGDSYDNALAKSQVALVKTELIEYAAPGDR